MSDGRPAPQDGAPQHWARAVAEGGGGDKMVVEEAGGGGGVVDGSKGPLTEGDGYHAGGGLKNDLSRTFTGHEAG